MSRFGRSLALLVVLASGTHAGTLILPLPGGSPQTIDFAHDPLIVFNRTTVPSQPFLDALGQAVAKHPAVEAAIADVAATSAVRTQVRAGLFPQIDAQFVGQRSLARDFGSQTAIVESLQPRGRADGIVSGEQLLYDFGATGNRISAATDRIKAAQAEVERVASDTALRAVVAYYDVLAYQTLLDLSAAMAGRQRAILGDVRDRVAGGVGAAGDTARADAVLADDEATTARFDRLLGQARARYAEAFGAAPPLRLARALPPPSTALSLDAAQALARKSPAVEAALRRADAARRDARAAKADGLPKLTSGITGSRYNVFDGSDYEVRGTVGVRQSLFAGGRQRGVIAEAGARARSAGYIADRVTAESERDAASAFTDVVALTRSAATLEAAYVANRRVRDGYVEQYRVSRGSLIELLRAENDYFSAATNYLQGVIELDVARYALLARTGEILPAAGIELKASAL